MGPSRVNPYSGQILDADIIFDADFLTYWKEEYETFTKESVAQTQLGLTNLDLDANGDAGTADVHGAADLRILPVKVDPLGEGGCGVEPSSGSERDAGSGSRSASAVASTAGS